MTALISNARMYAVAPGAERAWRLFLEALAARAGVPLKYVPHLFPEKLSELWARPDLGAAFVCGWPHLREGGVKQVLAAPVPAEEWAQGHALYRSVFVVRADSPWNTLEDSFGYRLAYTIGDSHSGYNAPRRHLMRWRKAGAPPLYGDVRGPAVTPRRAIEAVAAGEADITAIDSYCHALMARHEPELMRTTRVLAATEPTQIPSLMASPGADIAAVNALRGALLAFNSRDDAALLEPLCITGFATVEASGYGVTEQWAREAAAAGFETIA